MKVRSVNMNFEKKRKKKRFLASPYVLKIRRGSADGGVVVLASSDPSTDVVLNTSSSAATFEDCKLEVLLATVAFCSQC